MKNKAWISVLFLILLSVIAIVSRVYYVNSIMENVEINEEIYNAAKVSADGIKFSEIFSSGVNIKSLYICTLYGAFMVFGNFTVAGVYLNIIYQVITVLLVFEAVRNIFNRYIGFGVALIGAILPVYITRLSKVTSFDMGIAFIAFVVVILICVLRIVFKYIKAQKKQPQLQENVIEEQPPVVQNEVKVFEDTSMKEIHLDDVEEKKINYIENPLPVPKRREHKEMDFVVALTEETDDYDIKDMSGKDYFDIE